MRVPVLLPAQVAAVHPSREARWVLPLSQGLLYEEGTAAEDTAFVFLQVWGRPDTPFTKFVNRLRGLAELLSRGIPRRSRQRKVALPVRIAIEDPERWQVREQGD